MQQKTKRLDPKLVLCRAFAQAARETAEAWSSFEPGHTTKVEQCGQHIQYVRLFDRLLRKNSGGSLSREILQVYNLMSQSRQGSHEESYKRGVEYCVANQTQELVLEFCARVEKITGRREIAWRHACLDLVGELRSPPLKRVKLPGGFFMHVASWLDYDPGRDTARLSDWQPNEGRAKGAGIMLRLEPHLAEKLGALAANHKSRQAWIAQTIEEAEL